MDDQQKQPHEELKETSNDTIHTVNGYWTSDDNSQNEIKIKDFESSILDEKEINPVLADQSVAKTFSIGFKNLTYLLMVGINTMCTFNYQYSVPGSPKTSVFNVSRLLHRDDAKTKLKPLIERELNQDEFSRLPQGKQNELIQMLYTDRYEWITVLTHNIRGSVLKDELLSKDEDQGDRTGNIIDDMVRDLYKQYIRNPQTFDMVYLKKLAIQKYWLIPWFTPPLSINITSSHAGVHHNNESRGLQVPPLINFRLPMNNLSDHVSDKEIIDWQNWFNKLLNYDKYYLGVDTSNTTSVLSQGLVGKILQNWETATLGSKIKVKNFEPFVPAVVVLSSKQWGINTLLEHFENYNPAHFKAASGSQIGNIYSSLSEFQAKHVLTWKELISRLPAPFNKLDVSVRTVHDTNATKQSQTTKQVSEFDLIASLERWLNVNFEALKDRNANNYAPEQFFLKADTTDKKKYRHLAEELSTHNFDYIYFVFLDALANVIVFSLYYHDKNNEPLEIWKLFSK